MAKIAYMESTPRLKGKAKQFGTHYRRIALVEIEDNFSGRPRMISDRARGVVRVIESESVYIGKTARSAGRRRRDDMRARAGIVFD